jgi:hypothetical protein
VILISPTGPAEANRIFDTQIEHGVLLLVAKVMESDADAVRPRRYAERYLEVGVILRSVHLTLQNKIRLRMLRDEWTSEQQADEEEQSF